MSADGGRPDEVPDEPAVVDAETDGRPGPPSTGDPSLDMVRAALERAKAAARARGVVRQPAAQARARRRRRDDDGPQFSGARPDERDPQRVGSEIERIVAERGWEQTAQVATVLSCWDRLVGDDLARHCRPERLTDGQLVLVAESTAWATQVRLMTGTIRAKLAAEFGPDLVRSVTVRGPSGPDWRHGPRRVGGGRGPRDTYG